MQESNSLQIFGRLMTSLEGTSLTFEDKNLLLNKHVGGIILFSKNFESQLQIQSLCSEIKAVKENIIIAVDQEGGRVQRFKNEFTVLPSMQDLGDYAIEKNNMRICHEIGWLMASELVASGIDISFAPVLDVDRKTSSIIGNRSFSNDPKLLIKLARNFINGINKVVMMVSYINNENSIFSIIYNPSNDTFYHTHNSNIYKNFKILNPLKYNEHIGYLGDHAKIFFKNLISNTIDKKRSRSIGYDVIEIIEGERSFMTIYGSKIWDLFPAMSFLKILKFKTNLNNMNFDYSKLEQKIIFYAEI